MTLIRRGKTYHYDFEYGGHRFRESTHMTSITLAREVESKRKRELREGTAGIKKAAAPKILNIAAREWMELKRHRWSERTQSIAELALGHLLPILGRKLLVDVTARDISKYQKLRLSEGASNRTCNIEVSHLRQIMKRSGVWEKLRSSDEWADIGMLDESTDAGRRLSGEEEQRLLRECGRSASRCLLPFVTLLLESGSRYGTMQRLKWEQVDFRHRRLTFGKDKTRAGTGRTVPLSSRAFETLSIWAEQFPDRKPSHFVFATEKYGLHGSEGQFGGEVKPYLTDPTKPIGTLKSSWGSAKKRTQRHCPGCPSGLLADQPKPGTGYFCIDCHLELEELPAAITCRLHDLRHTAVSRLVAARVPLTTVAQIVGWSASTTAAMAVRYSHSNFEELREAVEVISAGSSQKSPQQEPASEAIVN
jgi:integrase